MIENSEKPRPLPKVLTDMLNMDADAAAKAHHELMVYDALVDERIRKAGGQRPNKGAI